MRSVRIAYIVSVLLLGLGSVAMNAFSGETALPVFSTIQVGLAVMTFPLGVLATLVAAGLIYSGFISPLEAFVLTTPIYASLGYLQWFWLFPKIYGSRVNVPEIRG